MWCEILTVISDFVDFRNDVDFRLLEECVLRTFGKMLDDLLGATDKQVMSCILILVELTALDSRTSGNRI